MQIYSLFMLFRKFLPFIFEWLYSVPVIGPFLSKVETDRFLENNYFTQRMYSKMNEGAAGNI